MLLFLRRRWFIFAVIVLEVATENVAVRRETHKVVAETGSAEDVIKSRQGVRRVIRRVMQRDSAASSAGYSSSAALSPNRVATASRDMLGCFGNTSDKQRLLHGGALNKTDLATMLEQKVDTVMDLTSWKMIEKEDAQKLNVPRCPSINPDAPELFKTTDALLGTHAANVHRYLDEELAHFDRSVPLVATVMEGFDISVSSKVHERQEKLWHAHTAKLSLNFLCGMRRLQLEPRLVIFALDEVTKTSLSTIGTNARVIAHPSLSIASERAANRTNTFRQGKNRVAKLLISLLVLERGFSVIMSDIDTYWVRDPTAYLTSLGVDLAAGVDGCPNTLNSGFVYYSPVEGPKKILRAALSSRKWQRGNYIIMTDNDQYLLNCAHARVFVAGGVRTWALPRPAFSFGVSKEGFVNYGCAGAGNSKAPEELPFIFHTAGASGPAAVGTTSMLQTLGFWDAQDAPNQGNGFCHAGVRNNSEQAQLVAFKAGQSACQRVWHARCDCKRFSPKRS